MTIYKRGTLVHSTMCSNLMRISGEPRYEGDTWVQPVKMRCETYRGEPYPYYWSDFEVPLDTLSPATAAVPARDVPEQMRLL